QNGCGTIGDVDGVSLATACQHAHGKGLFIARGFESGISLFAVHFISEIFQSYDKSRLHLSKFFIIRIFSKKCQLIF
ncbi:MAG: hypothetical protein DRI57_33340, partial [Deltaproteobacteria bacterium]